MRSCNRKAVPIITHANADDACRNIKRLREPFAGIKTHREQTAEELKRDRLKNGGRQHLPQRLRPKQAHCLHSFLQAAVSV
jgi:hypothetical protein